MIRRFLPAISIAVIGIAIAIAYGGPSAAFPILALAVLEISLSFDNAVVNASVLQRMSRAWRIAFLTVGIILAVFVVRLVIPFVIVSAVAGITPADTIRLALQHGPVDETGSFGYILNQAHPMIAGFGGAFLLMLFWDFILEPKELRWLRWVEAPLEAAGRFKQLAVIVTLLICAAVAIATPAQTGPVLLAAAAGLVTYFLISGLGDLLEAPSSDEEARPRSRRGAGFVLFLYLELLDASFSLDGVVGAFALSADPILIAIGLGIGAMFVRSLTILFVERSTLRTFPYLEHGGFWAIGALGFLMLLSITIYVPEAVSGTVGIVFIAAAFLSSILTRKPHPQLTATGADA